MKIIRLNENFIKFFVDYSIINTSNIFDIHKYLMKKTWDKRILGIIQDMVIVLLSSIASAPNHKKRVLLSNQKWETEP